MRKYLHLADSTNADFVEEAELEELKQQVIRAIRNNTASEAELKDLETKISLLIRNKVTLEEVVKTTSKQYRVKKPREGNAETDIFSMKALDKESRQKLEGYQSLFYLLQTQPQYLGKLMFLVHRKWNGAFNSFAEGVVMALFGYAQQAREEYMLLQLIKTSIGFEVKDAKEISDIAKAQPFSVRLLLHYTRAPGQRKYLQQTLGPLVKEILESKDLDLSTDVVAVSFLSFMFGCRELTGFARRSTARSFRKRRPRADKRATVLSMSRQRKRWLTPRQGLVTPHVGISFVCA